MRRYILLLIFSLFLVLPVYGQDKSVDQLNLENLNLQLRVMQLEFQQVKAQRDRLQAQIEQQIKSQEKVKVPEKRDTEE